eukprot:226781-Rhodomonas_salina.1
MEIFDSRYSSGVEVALSITFIEHLRENFNFPIARCTYPMSKYPGTRFSYDPIDLDTSVPTPPPWVQGYYEKYVTRPTRGKSQDRTHTEHVALASVSPTSRESTFKKTEIDSCAGRLDAPGAVTQ